MCVWGGGSNKLVNPTYLWPSWPGVPSFTPFPPAALFTLFPPATSFTLFASRPLIALARCNGCRKRQQGRSGRGVRDPNKICNLTFGPAGPWGPGASRLLM